MDHLMGRTGVPILIIEEPVRHGKSLYYSRMLPGWHTGVYPDKQTILMSATDDLTKKWGRHTRKDLVEHGHLFGVEISKDRSSQSDWETTQQGGMLCAGMLGSIIGMDCHLGIVDDYLKNAKDALSETIRETQWDNFQSAMLTRLEPGGKIIVGATRWHSDDLIGRITGESPNVEEALPHVRIRLPAIAEENDPLGREVGEALWPERWPLGEDNNKMVMNAWGQRTIGLLMRRGMYQRSGKLWQWDALYQQKPGSRGLALWPESYWLNDLFVETMPRSSIATIVSADTAEGKTTGCYSAITGIKLFNDKLHVTPLIGKEPPEITIGRAIELCRTIKSKHLVIEAQMFTSLVEGRIEYELRQRNMAHLEVMVIRNIVSKNDRIQRLGEYWERNQIKILNTTEGRMLLNEAKNFSIHEKCVNDGLDALEMGIRHLPQTVGVDSFGFSEVDT